MFPVIGVFFCVFIPTNPPYLTTMVTLRGGSGLNAETRSWDRCMVFPLNEEKNSWFPRIANWFHRDINHLFNIYVTTRDRKVLCHPWGGNAQALHARQLSESRQKRAIKQIWLSKHVRRTMFPRHLCSWADREAWQFSLMSWVPILPTLLK